MSLPSYAEVRSRIDKTNDNQMQLCLKTLTLIDGRICEIVAKKYDSDKNTKIYGDKLTCETTTTQGIDDADLRIILGKRDIPIAIFNVATAKKFPHYKRKSGAHREPTLEDITRRIALPLAKRFADPWTQEVYDHIKAHSPPFPFTRQEAYQFVHDHGVFEGLTYPIEYYEVWKNGEVVKMVNPHPKPFNLHAIRHVVTTYLHEALKFDGFDLALYGGWSMMSVSKMEEAQRQFGRSYTGALSQVQRRYALTRWIRYFPKLLKKRLP